MQIYASRQLETTLVILMIRNIMAVKYLQENGRIKEISD